MPVEIRELVIKTIVNQEEGSEGASSSSSPGSESSHESANLSQKALIQACVEEVLKILKREKQR